MLQARRFPRTMSLEGTPNDPLKLESSGFVVNVSFDLAMATYYDDVAQDGFLIDVGRMMYAGSTPVAVPSGADVMITVSASKQEQLTECYPHDKTPKLKYFDYYDTMGQFWFAEHTIYDKIISMGGCDVPLMTRYRKLNSTVPPCPPEVVAFMKAFDVDAFSTCSKV